METGLRDVLSATTREWTPQEFEELFSRLIALATGRMPQTEAVNRVPFAADMVLLRELAHHGRLAGIRLA